MRNLFPYAPDKAVIAAFIKGAGTGHRSDWLQVDDNTLKLCIGAAAPIAWVAPSDGALYGMVPVDAFVAAPAMRALNHMLDDMDLTPERVAFEPGDPGTPTRWLYGGQLIESGKPFLICGPMGLIAMRVTMNTTGGKS